MIKKLFFILILFLYSIVALSRTKHIHTERYYQELDCKGQLEVTFDDGTRADCLDGIYATEYDYACKWYESVGQSLHYAMKSGLKPRIVLIIDKKQYKKYFKIALPLCQKYDIKLDIIEDYGEIK